MDPMFMLLILLIINRVLMGLNENWDLHVLFFP